MSSRTASIQPATMAIPASRCNTRRSVHKKTIWLFTFAMSMAIRRQRGGFANLIRRRGRSSTWANPAFASRNWGICRWTLLARSLRELPSKNILPASSRYCSGSERGGKNEWRAMSQGGAGVGDPLLREAREVKASGPLTKNLINFALSTAEHRTLNNGCYRVTRGGELRRGPFARRERLDRDQK